MSEMVERVARAIYETEPFLNQGEVVAWERLTSWGKRDSLVFARAAIEAMREPTAGMVEATEGWDSHRVAWQLMIDAALTPSE